MCLFSKKPTHAYAYPTRTVLDPPRHSSRYSAHPPPGVVRIPRGRRSSFRVADRYYEDRYVVEPRHSARVVGYVEEPRRSRSVVRGVDVRRSVSRVRY